MSLERYDEILGSLKTNPYRMRTKLTIALACQIATHAGDHPQKSELKNLTREHTNLEKISASSQERAEKTLASLSKLEGQVSSLNAKLESDKEKVVTLHGTMASRLSDKDQQIAYLEKQLVSPLGDSKKMNTKRKPRRRATTSTNGCMP